MRPLQKYIPALSFTRVCFVVLSCVVFFAQFATLSVSADDSGDTDTQLPQSELDALNGGWVNYVTGGGTCASSATTNSSQTTTGGISSGSSVYVLGDAIAQTAKAELSNAFAQNNISVTVDADSGRTLTTDGASGSSGSNGLSGMGAISLDQGYITSAGAIVIELGTNGGDTTQAIDQAISAIRVYNSSAPIYWVDTISVGRTDGYNQTTIGPANTNIYSEASSQNYQVLSWFKTVDPNGTPQSPGGAETDPNSYIDQSSAGNGIIPTASGVTAFDSLVVSGVSNGSLTTNSGSCCLGGSAELLSGSNNVTKIYNYFITKGLTAAQAAGIMGNLQSESNFNPEQLEVEPGQVGNNYGVETPVDSLTQQELSDPTLGWGLPQWTPINKMVGPTLQAKLDPDDLGVQLDFLWNSISGPIVSAIKSTSTPQEAALDFLTMYEKPYVPPGQQLPTDTPTREEQAQALYVSFTQGTPLPPSDQTTTVSTSGSCGSSGSTSTTSSSSGGGGTGSYMNPLRSISGLTPERIDQGVDYVGSGSVYAIGDATVTLVVTTDSGWPGLGSTCDPPPDASPCNGAFIEYQLSDGPAKGDFVYFAEDCQPSVTAGEQLTSSSAICTMLGGSTSIETGWGVGGTGEAVLGAAQYQTGGGGNFSTSAGQNFSALLQSLGAPPGVLQPSHSSSTLSGYPTW